MVKQAIISLEEAMGNVWLLETGREEDRIAYRDGSFNGWFGVSLAHNIPILLEYLEKESRGESLEGLLPGQEQSRIFSTFVACIPEIDDPRWVKEKIYSNRPKFNRMEELDVESKASTLEKKTHDGAIGWGKSIAGSYVISKSHIAFGETWSRAADAANRLTGRNEEALDDAIAPLIQPALINAYGMLKPTIGLKTRNAACVALAIPGAFTITPKGTVYQLGLPRVTMYGNRGIDCEGCVAHVPKQELSKYRLPRGNTYLVPERELAIVKKRYTFDSEIKAARLLGTPEILSPEQLGLRQLYLARCDDAGYAAERDFLPARP